MPAQRGAAGVVDLHRHQPRRHLDDVRLEPQLGQGVGGLEPEQAAADDRADRRGGRGLADRLEVLDGPVDEAAGQLVAGHRRHERRGAGGEHELVVLRAPGRRRAARSASRGRTPRRRCRATSSTRGSSYAPSGSRESASAPTSKKEVSADPVVRRARLLADDDDVVGLGEAALDGGLHEAVADHAVADDDEAAAVLGAHARVPSRVGTVRWARSWRDGVGAAAAAGGGAGRSRGPRPARRRPGSRPALTPAHAQTSASAGTEDVGRGGRSGISRAPGSAGPRTVRAVEVLGDQADPGQVADQGRGDHDAVADDEPAVRADDRVGHLDDLALGLQRVAQHGDVQAGGAQPGDGAAAVVRRGLAVEDPGEHARPAPRRAARTR